MNQVIVSALVRRANTQQVQIHFGKEGHGDDIVDQWADRLILGMQATVAHTKAQTEEVLRTIPPPETASSYYWKTFICGNCARLNMVWFLKGKRAPESVICETCACDTAKCN